MAHRPAIVAPLEANRTPDGQPLQQAALSLAKWPAWRLSNALSAATPPAATARLLASRTTLAREVDERIACVP